MNNKNGLCTLPSIDVVVETTEWGPAPMCDSKKIEYIEMPGVRTLLSKIKSRFGRF